MGPAGSSKGQPSASASPLLSPGLCSLPRCCSLSRPKGVHNLLLPSCNGLHTFGAFSGWGGKMSKSRALYALCLLTLKREDVGGEGRSMAALWEMPGTLSTSLQPEAVAGCFTNVTNPYVSVRWSCYYTHFRYGETEAQKMAQLERCRAGVPT